MRQWPCESNGYFCITRFYLRTNGVITNADPLVSGQCFQPHWATRVEFLCAYRHFRTQTKLAAVGKTRRGVNVNSGRIHFVNKTLGVAHIAGQDRIGVLCAVFTNMGDGIVKIADDFDVQI